LLLALSRLQALNGVEKGKPRMGEGGRDEEAAASKTRIEG